MPGFDRAWPGPYHFALMSAEAPDAVDAWRMVASRRSFDGTLPLAGMARLRDLLTDAEGDVRFSLEFGRDTLQVPFAALRLEASLPLICQRSLQRFLYPVALEQRYGLVAQHDEVAEAGLPPGYEALEVGDDGRLEPAALVEDELILAVPLVPVSPGSHALEQDWPAQAEETAQANPFAALAALKKT